MKLILADLNRSASLKARCPAGIYLSLTPGDPSKWSGVIFVREGIYLILCDDGITARVMWH